MLCPNSSSKRAFIGLKTDATDIAYNSEPNKDVDGQRVWAHWVWCQYAIDFIKQDGEWKIWHFRCLETARCPYHEDWITFAKKNKIAFERVSDFAMLLSICLLIGSGSLEGSRLLR